MENNVVIKSHALLLASRPQTVLINGTQGLKETKSQGEMMLKPWELSTGMIT